MPKVSIIIPFYNEEAIVAEVLAEVAQCQPGAEIIAVDDGSSDGTWTAIARAPGVRGIRFERNQGQSAAMYAGLTAASGEICVNMDGDGQNDPADIATLVARLEDSGSDVVCGYRAKRKDTASRRYASKIANAIRRSILDDGLRDTGCSLKAFKREAVACLIPFNGMHRYLAAFFRRAGYTIEEVPVNHRPRAAGSSKYTNFDRALRGIYDLFGVSWYLKRRVDPRLIAERSGSPHEHPASHE